MMLNLWSWGLQPALVMGALVAGLATVRYAGAAASEAPAGRTGFIGALPSAKHIPADVDVSDADLRGATKSKGLKTPVSGQGVLNKKFRDVLTWYGGLTSITYDVSYQRAQESASGVNRDARYGADLANFSKEGLVLRYQDHTKAVKTGYDYSKHYTVVANISANPESVFGEEENWFGYIAISKDKGEGAEVIVCSEYIVIEYFQ